MVLQGEMVNFIVYQMRVQETIPRRYVTHFIFATLK